MPDFSQFWSGDLFSLVIIPILIFLSRIIDVSIGTLRIIFVSRGLRYWATFLGFFEILVWVIAIGQVMQNLTSWVTYLAYALGFSTGNWVGISIERKLAMGSLIVRVVTRQEGSELVKFLWNSGYGVTSVDARGETGPVKIIFSIVKRKKLPHVLDIIKRFNPNAFYTIEDVRFVNETYSSFPPLSRRHIFGLRTLRKSK